MTTEEPIRTSEKLIGFAKASQPMSKEELQDFRAKLMDGWNPCAREPKSDSNEAQAAEPKAVLDLVGEIEQWIDLFTVENLTIVVPRSTANAAFVTFTEGRPLATAELLEFWKNYATAYERVLKFRAELGSGTGSSEFPFSLANASSKGKAIKKSLENLLAYEANHPSRALIFRLFHFAGCKPDEIAIYTETDVLEVKKIIENMEFDVIDPTLVNN